jgi:hypothetical protein
MATATSNSGASQGLASRSAPEPPIAKVTTSGRSLNRGPSAATVPWVAVLRMLAVGSAVVLLVLAYGWYGARAAKSPCVKVQQRVQAAARNLLRLRLRR